MSRRKNKLVPFETIVLATQGDHRHWNRLYGITDRTYSHSAAGNTLRKTATFPIVCDNELKLRLETKLMAKILLFDIRERTYKT